MIRILAYVIVYCLFILLHLNMHKCDFIIASL